MNASFDASLALRTVFLGSVLALGACQSTPPATTPEQAAISDERTATAQVVALAPAERLVTLRGEGGRIFSVFAGQAVRNFKEIEVGDELRVRYRETLTATRHPDGAGASLVEGAVAAGRAEAGAMPGAGVGLAIRLWVEIESIDLANDIVVFSTASGELIAHRVATDEGRAFVAGLQRGDTVQLDYTEALALSIERL